MKRAHRILRYSAPLVLGLGVAWACGFDGTLREYLDARFWLPLAKHSSSFERKGVRRISVPFAGMVKAQDNKPLNKLRAAYQGISANFDVASLRQDVAAARADGSLTPREREEVDLIDAKIDMRDGEPDQAEPLQSAEKKLQQFLKSARTPEFLSEARGWLAHVEYELGDQTAAGKIYLDELNRNGSNLSRETLLNSLSLTYGYDGGQELLDHLEEYFDTPEHAAFAIQLITNPRWDGYERPYDRKLERQQVRPDKTAKSFARIQSLLENHQRLFGPQAGASGLALLSMRTALRMGDPPAALKIAEMIPANSAIRSELDFEWMLASARFLSHDYAGAERPLLDLFASPQASQGQKAAAAYALCGVYRKTGDSVEQIRFALSRPPDGDGDYPSSGNEDLSVYWAFSGWDLNLLLESEAPVEALEGFITKYPDAKDVRKVQYSLAVRLARANRYQESADLYQSINATRRATRMRQLAVLYKETARTDLSPQQLQEAKYKLAEFIAAHPDAIYFNDELWGGLQRYALYADQDSRFTRAERDAAIDAERTLKDDQEERWRAYLILRDVVQEAGKTDLGRKAAQLAINCVRRISPERFGRRSELVKADLDLSKWLRQP